MADEKQLLEYLKKVTIELNDTRARLSQAQESATEAIAIVGIGCRYPGGAHSAEELWRLVAEGHDAISEFPTDRGWDLETSQDAELDGENGTAIRHGGFLREAGQFDPAFFGIGSREALAMDPQQRLLLEASWEAIEHAGIDPLTLRGGRTGVFAGVLAQEYGLDALASASEDMQLYLGMSGSASMLSGRVSYIFGLEGPAVTINTACSSSLVAVHLACQALRAGDCDLAMASGVTVNITPSVFVQFGRVAGLAPDGKCKSFGADADGTGLSEGVGVLLLERLSEAKRLGHDVLGLIRASSLNQDGASNGITAPNRLAQERVIRQALATAGLSHAQVDAVEAHGTGTELGDPIEAEALLATYGQDRPEGRPLWLGSIKSNIGHAQAAAGIAGVIKMVMAMRHGVLPRTLHVEEPSKQVNWSTGAVELLRTQVPWPRGDEPRRAGVSSFGVSGTNAHIILEEFSPEQTTPSAARPAHNGSPPASRLGLLDGETTVWPISAKDEEALHAQAQRLRNRAEDGGDLCPVDVGFSLASARSAFDRRAVVVGDRRDALLGGLAALAVGEPCADVARGVAHAPGKLAFVFPGQGSQWPGMARELLDASPVFAEHMSSCGDALGEYVDWSLLEVLRDPDSASLDRLDVLQPALFAVMVSLAGLWRACGVRPAAVVGHSQGEIAAACVAGCLSLRDATRVVALRSRLLTTLIGQGSVLSVKGPRARVEQLLERWEGRLWVAVVNGPRSLVLTGEREALAELGAICAQEDMSTREIRGGVAAGHSPQVDVLRDQLLEALDGIAPKAGDIPLYSTVTAAPLDGAELGADYWCRNMREPVQFEGAVQGLLERGFRTFVEISPHPMLSVDLHEIADSAAGNPLVGRDRGHTERPDAPVGAAAPVVGEIEIETIGSLRREQGGVKRFLLSLGEAWVRGVQVDWAAVFAGTAAQRIPLPTYAFKRQRYWLEPRAVAPVEYIEGPDTQAPTVAPLIEKLALAPEGEGERVVLTAVQQQLAAVLGDVQPERVQPDQPFLELGLDSVGAVELSSRLRTLTGLAIPKAIVFDHRTPAALASYIHARADRQVRASGSSESTRADAEDDSRLLKTIESLLDGGAYGQDMMDDFLRMLIHASGFRPRFDLSGEPYACPQPLKLSEGATRPTLICLPSVTPMSGPHEYVRLARALGGDREVIAIPVPGFLEGERLPASIEAVVEVFASALRDRDASEPFVLAGHSSGGMLAYALAGALELYGMPPAGVIAFDTYMFGHGNTEELTKKLMGGLVGVDGTSVEVNDVRLTAMGGYLRLLADFQPAEVASPALLLRAADSNYGRDSDVAHGTSWGRSWHVVEVPGDHFSIMDNHVESTARAVESWIGELSPDGVPVG